MIPNMFRWILVMSSCDMIQSFWYWSSSEMLLVCCQGALRDGSEIAVKELPYNIKQGNQEFLNEVQLITGLQHKNLVKLCGCAISASNRMLVYEYVDNKTLAQALFG